MNTRDGLLGSDSDVNRIRNAAMCGRHEFNITTLSLVPRVFSIELLLTDFECDWIMKLGHERMEEASGAGQSNNAIWHSRGRTSTQAAVASGVDAIMTKIHSRVHAILRTPTDNRSEPLQVLVSPRTQAQSIRIVVSFPLKTRTVLDAHF